ncbi:hypothetical protein N3K66_005768 [Trichothecium roseum]|uniref:Uncharacterized protein n=1 Tax=Trichothecium roseum TaxID=47278 RepID=A0ACC0V0G8_9HYPO|nr:hypothetical protein N3K66_005768 [Trichothecium roseum]
MDIHRCRFVPYQPSAINAIAFSHPKTKSGQAVTDARLAIGRANGDVEIWNPQSGAWHQELIIRGGKDRSIDGLVWVNEPDQDFGDGRILAGKSRLFSIGYTSAVTEWDLEKGKPKRYASGQHGDIWCMAAQPALSHVEKGSESQASNKLIAGTIDGELVMYSIEDDDLRFQRVMVRSPTKKAQMVSMAFQSRKVVIVGCSDSTIRAYNTSNGHMIRRMTLGSDLVGGSKEIIAWAVQCLPNGNIVSGDSTGQVCIWDGKTYTQAQRVQSHKSDVLSLAVSADGTSIVSGGMDRRTVHYKPGQGGRWTKVWGRRYHDHDVKAMAAFESTRISVVVSGGPDANPILVPLKEMGRENHRTIPSLPHQTPIASAPDARFIVSWWDREVNIWALRNSANQLLDSEEEEADLKQNRKLLKTIVVKGDSNISSATINKQGSLLVVSTTTDVKAFQLTHSDPTRPSDVLVEAIEIPERLSRLGATSIQLSPDSNWLCAVQEGRNVLVASVGQSRGAEGTSTTFTGIKRVSRVHHDIPRHVQNGGLGRYDRNIVQMTFSTDSRMLAVADLAGYVDTWVLNSEDIANASHEDDVSSDDSDSSQDEETDVEAAERWVRNPNSKVLPKLPSAPTLLSFSDDVPGNDKADYTLLAITSTWHILAFHPLQGSLTSWSRKHPRKALPTTVRNLLDLAKGVVWQGSRAWVYGISFLTMIDFSLDIPKTDAEVPDQSGVKRKRKGATSGAGGKMALSNLTPHSIRKHASGGQEEDIDMDDAQPVDDASNSEDDEDAGDDASKGNELAQLRANGTLQANGSSKFRSWWITFKYRPIFGIVPLSSDGDLEVALVERPIWDVEMAERYYVGEEWER